MKKLLAVVSFALLAACATTGGTPKMSPSQPGSIGKVRHVVLFKFKDGTSPEQVRQIEEAFAALPAKLPLIKDFEWGTDVSPEGLQAGHTHCFLVTFDSTADRDAYLPHPAHKEFVALLLPHLDKATVVDYVAKR